MTNDAEIVQHAGALLRAVLSNVDWTETIRSVLTAIVGGVGSYRIAMRRGGRVLEHRVRQERVKQTEDTARALLEADARADELSDRLARIEGYLGVERNGNSTSVLRRIRRLERGSGPAGEGGSSDAANSDSASSREPGPAG